MPSMTISGKVELINESGKKFTETFNTTLSNFKDSSMRDINIGAASATTVWDAAATSQLTKFQYLFIKCTQDVEIELSCNNGASEQIFLVTMEANTPFILTKDDSYYSVGTDAFTGSADTIDLIRVKSTNASILTIWMADET